MSFIVAAMSARRRGVGQQRHLTAVLDRHGDVALVLPAVAADAGRADLAAVRDVLAQRAGVLVVDVGHLVLAELADLLLQLAGRWLGHRLSSPGRASKSGGCLEGRLVGPAARARGATGGRAGPRVVTAARSAAGRSAVAAAAVGLPAAAEAATPAAATARGLGDL